MMTDSLYRCPSCEWFFRAEDWSEENDICKPCLDGMEEGEEDYEDSEEIDPRCFFCNQIDNCICDEITDRHRERNLDT